MKLGVIILIILILSFIFISGCELQNPIKTCEKITKYKTINQKGCEGTTGCECTHQSWAGLGQCDTCSCEYQEEVCQ